MTKLKFTFDQGKVAMASSTSAAKNLCPGADRMAATAAGVGMSSWKWFQP